MISHVLFMCLTNTISSSSSNMNNSSSTNTNIEENKQTSEDILDVIFDYTGNGDDELTLRFENAKTKKKQIYAYNDFFLFFFIDEEVN